MKNLNLKNDFHPVDRQPLFQINFTSHDAMITEIQFVVIKTINEALLAARGNLSKLKELQAMFKEGTWITSGLIDDAINGPSRGKNESPEPEALV